MILYIPLTQKVTISFLMWFLMNFVLEVINMPPNKLNSLDYYIFRSRFQQLSSILNIFHC